MRTTTTFARSEAHPFVDRQYSDSNNFLMLFLETDRETGHGRSYGDETTVWVNYSLMGNWSAEASRHRSSWIDGEGYASREEESQEVGLMAAFMAFAG